MNEIEYGSERMVLKYYAGGGWHAVSVMVDDQTVTPDANGRKIVKAGTIVGGKTQKVLTNRSEPVIKKNSADAEGVLLHDADVTHGPQPTAMIVRGYVDLLRIPEAPDVTAIAALKDITFMK